MHVGQVSSHLGITNLPSFRLQDRLQVQTFVSKSSCVSTEFLEHL